MKLSQIAIVAFCLILLPIGMASAQRTFFDLGDDFSNPRNSPLIDPDRFLDLMVVEVICTNEQDEVTISFRDEDEVHISIKRVGETRIRTQRTFDVDNVDGIAVNTFADNDRVTVSIDHTFSSAKVLEMIERQFGFYVELGRGDDEFDNSSTEFHSTVMGSWGSDTLIGGENWDTLHGNPMIFRQDIEEFREVPDHAIDTVHGNGGDDNLHGEYVTGGDGGDDITSPEVVNIGGNGAYAMIAYGGEGNDRIYGTTATDYIYGQGDNDRIYGIEGSDYLSGGDGDDQIFSNRRFWINQFDTEGDVMSGGEGNDKLYAGSGNDMLFGGGDNDELYGGDGVDQLIGGDGDDVLSGSVAGLGLNEPTEDGSEDYLEGGADNDTFITWYFKSFTIQRGPYKAHEEEPQDLEPGDTWEQIKYSPKMYGYPW